MTGRCNLKLERDTLGFVRWSMEALAHAKEDGDHR